ncbi:MAG: hypothetical protein Q8N69_01065 [bacterium]|nr:hypothetical protein [bacterium]
MRELKNVKDVLKDVRRFERSFDPKTVVSMIKLYRNGCIKLRFNGMNSPYKFVALAEYFFELRRRIKIWAIVHGYEFSVRFYQDDTIDVRNSFSFIPKKNQKIIFADPVFDKHPALRYDSELPLLVFNLH